jgi:transcriptional regulator with XRE-family HTH domain
MLDANHPDNPCGKSKVRGEELSAILKRERVSQARLGRLLGVSAEHVSRWRNDGYAVPVYAALLLRLVQGNRITFEDLEAIRTLYEPDPPRAAS